MLSLSKLFSDEKESIDREYPFLMLYLSCLSSSELDSRELHKAIASMKSVLGRIVEPFARLNLLVNVWAYEQIRAIGIVSKSVKHKALKGLLKRLADAISVGLGMKTFLKSEYDKFSITYTDEYKRVMDRLKVLCDAYVALLTSVTVIAVSLIMVSLIFSFATLQSIMWIVALMMMSIAASITLFILKRSPYDKVVAEKPMRDPKIGGKERMAVILFVLSLAVPSISIILHYIGVKLPYVTPSQVMMLMGAVALYFGLVGRREVGRIKHMDEYAPIFMKSFGDALSISNSFKGALRIITSNDYGPLTPLVNRLHKRLELELDPYKCMRAFERESSSRLIYKTGEIFFSSLRMGARPTQTGTEVYNFLIVLMELRKRREQVAGYLKGMLVPIQISTASLFAVLDTLVGLLATLGTYARSYLNVLEISETRTLTLFLLSVILLLCISGALNIGGVEGDSPVTKLYYLGMLMLLSGGAFWATRFAVGEMFGFFMKINLLKGV